MAEIKTISEIIEEVVPYYKKQGGPDTEHKLIYDSSTETLEPVYFWVLDLMNDMGLEPEKLIDNFATSPGSGHFSELRGKATAMQQQGTKIMADINTVLRSVLNIIYDLRDFKIRLQSYDDLHSDDKKISEAARLSIKQIWLDKVDINKGNSSIKAMALGQAGFQTLLDAFLAANDEKAAEKLDLNDRVKRILLPRVHEFKVWLKESERELRKRYELERTYLKSQVNSLKLYSRWVKPYLRAAQDLEMKETGREPDLVKVFNTILLELTLLGKQKLDIEKSSLAGDLPADFQKLKVKRDYYSCVLVDFRFRGIPQRVVQQQHFAFGGRAEMTFRAYSLNEDELAKIEEEFDKSDLEDVLRLVEGSTTESLDKLQEDINYFLEEESEEENKGKKTKDQSNPFLALIGYYDKPSKPKEESKEKSKEKKGEVIIRKETWIEKNHFRVLAGSNAVEIAFKLFDVYKKAHGMPSYT